jgi:hypothetical protein
VPKGPCVGQCGIDCDQLLSAEASAEIAKLKLRSMVFMFVVVFFCVDRTRERSRPRTNGSG